MTLMLPPSMFNPRTRPFRQPRLSKRAIIANGVVAIIAVCALFLIWSVVQ